MVLRTFSMLEGLPVIHSKTGHNYGRMYDLLWKNDAVHGFVVDQKGWLNRHLFLPIQLVYSFGRDSVMIRNSSSLSFYSNRKSHTYCLKYGRNRLRGMSLFTEEGERLGLLEDVYFRQKMGTIVAYKITEGFIADLTEGRKVIKSSALVVSKDRAILMNE